MFNKNSLLLYAVTDSSWLNEGETLAEAVEKALEGGVTMIQLREKNLGTDEFVQLAVEIKNICSKSSVPLIINDSVEVCLAADADGVHLGQGDMAIEKARRLLGDTKIIGITAKTVEQALAAQSGGADYLGSGAVFGTSTKADAKKSWDDAHMTPAQRAEKARAERDEKIASAKERTAAANERYDAAKKN